MQILLISGPAGVGKSTVSWEIGRKLAEANVNHAIIDCDELDRVHPQPEPLSDFVALSRRNLAALWHNFSALGHTRLILTGVMLNLRDDLAWISEAVESAEITVVRLLASDSTLRARLDVREIGSGKDDQLKRTLDQAAKLRGEETENTLVVKTDDRSPTVIASEILDRTMWGLD